MNNFFYSLAKIFKIIPLQSLVTVTGQRVILPFYHLISDENVVHVKNLYPVKSIDKFKKELDFLLKHYKPVDFHEFISSGKTKENCFLLSFDDGLREFYDNVAPILRQKGVPAICFFNSGFLDNKDLFFRYKTSILMEELKTSKISAAKEKELKNWFQANKLVYGGNHQSLLSINYANRACLDELASMLDVSFPEYLQKNKPYMESWQIRELINQGFHFGAHSIDHPLYAGIDEREQLRQTKQSVADVTSSFNLDYRLFAFPFSDSGVSARFFEQVSDVVDLTFGTAGLKRDSCAFNRQRIGLESGNYTAQEIVYGEYLYYICKAFLGRNKVVRLH